MALKDKRVQAGSEPDARVAAAIAARLEGGRLPCTAAWTVADELGIDPHSVGRTADIMQVRLSACQLGFFGPALQAASTGTSEPAVPEGFGEALLMAREQGGISCGQLWREADRFDVPRLAAGGVADRLGLKIRHCDLGAF